MFQECWEKHEPRRTPNDGPLKGTIGWNVQLKEHLAHDDCKARTKPERLAKFYKIHGYEPAPKDGIRRGSRVGSKDVKYTDMTNEAIEKSEEDILKEEAMAQNTAILQKLNEILPLSALPQKYRRKEVGSIESLMSARFKASFRR